MEDRALAEIVDQARLATLGMLVAGFAHEVNTPLGAVSSNHDVLRRALARLQEILADEVVEPGELDEVRRIVRALDGILRVNDMAVERMTNLVHSLRNFGRPDRAEIAVVDLHEGIASTLTILGHELRHIDVVTTYGTLPAVRCHPHRLTQVWTNLILNAAQAMPDGGRLEITTAAQDEHVIVSITDTGVGIDAATLPRIFEPGFTTKGERIGMGLGLLIAREIVDQHSGRMEVESTPGAGSRFRVILPTAGR